MANFYSGWVTPPNGGTRYRVWLSVTQTSQSIEDNTSTLTWYLRIQKEISYNGFYNYPSASWGVNLDGGGEELSGSGTKPDAAWTGTSTWLLGSGTKVIAHNSDGTKSLTNISADFTRSASGWAPGTMSFSGKTLTLTTIPRATQPTVSPVSGNTAATYTITHDPAASSFYHDVAYSLDGGDTYTNIATNIIGTDTSTAWTPAHSLLPDSTSVTAIIRVITKDGSGGATIGTKTVSLPLTVPSSVKPTISSVAWADDQTVSPDMPTLMGGAGRFVQRWSKLEPTISSAGASGSTVEDTHITMNGQETVSGTPFTSAVAISGSVPFTATVTDSRDRDSDPFASTVTVKAYNFPSLPTPLVSRTSDSGGATPDPAGTYLAITPAASVSSLNFGDGEKNLLEWRVRTRPAGGSWTTVQDWTASTVSGNVWTTKYVAGGSYAADTEYEVEVSIRDVFGKNGFSTSQTVVTKTVAIATESVFMDRNADQGVGFGRYHADGGKFIQVAGGADIEGGLEADEILQDGNAVLDASDFSTTAETAAASSGAKVVTPASLAIVLPVAVADLNALPSAASYREGTRIHVDALNVDFVQMDGTWVQVGTAVVASIATRNSEYAKASSAYLIDGVECMVATTPRVRYSYYTSAAGTVEVTGWFPTGGALPFFRQTPSGTQNVGTSSWTLCNAIWGSAEALVEFTSYASGVLTVKHTGLYLVEAIVSFPTTGGGARATQIVVNSTSVDTDDSIAASQAESLRGVNTSTVVRLEAGDAVRVYAFQTSGATRAIQTLGAETHWTARYLGPA